MYCNHCGTTLQTNQGVCPSCGKAQPAAEARSRLASHVHLLGIFWIIIGVLTAIGALFLLGLGSLAGAFMRAPDVPMQARMIAPIMFWSLGIFTAAIAVVGFIAGFGLLKVRPWARVLAIVLGFISLLNAPFGTALGVYTLVILLPSTAAEEYQRIAVPA